MPRLAALGALLEERFAEHLRAIDPEAPRHRVEFSRRITESWALIYYRRHLVRLSPYVFLLDPQELKYGSHWMELDATLRHEAAHAATFHQHDHTGHGEDFHRALAILGLRANGSCDLGPENVAFRYIYACPQCECTWPRRTRLNANHSCGGCAPGGYSAEHKLVLREERDLATRLRERRDWMRVALADGRAVMRVRPFDRPAPHVARPLLREVRLPPT